jgi:hypothetical protein
MGERAAPAAQRRDVADGAARASVERHLRDFNDVWQLRAAVLANAEAAACERHRHSTLSAAQRAVPHSRVSAVRRLPQFGHAISPSGAVWRPRPKTRRRLLRKRQRAASRRSCAR